MLTERDKTNFGPQHYAQVGDVIISTKHRSDILRKAAPRGCQANFLCAAVLKSPLNRQLVSLTTAVCLGHTEI